MTLPTFTMRQLLEAGVHFGHHTRRWNPKMAPYIFGVRSAVHIIDLEQTMPLLTRALAAIRDVVAAGGRVLFVGTKRQAAEKVAEAGKRSGQYYVNHRWLGGMLTNWNTISKSIKRLRELDDALVDEQSSMLTKKELLRLTRERDKLERALGGIKEMGARPDILFVIDTNKEAIAVAEAKKLGIPIVGIVDSNSEPNGITFPVPGNDDAMRAITLYCDLVADSVLAGLQEELRASGVDVGAAEEVPGEPLPAPAKDAAETAPAAKEIAAEPPTPKPAAEETPAEAAAEAIPSAPIPAPPAVEEIPAEAAAEATPPVPIPAPPAAEETPAEAAAEATPPAPIPATPAAEEIPAEAAPEAEAAATEPAPPAAEEKPGEPAAAEAVAEPADTEAVVKPPAARKKPAKAKKPATTKKPAAKKKSAPAKPSTAKKPAAAKDAAKATESTAKD